jgi:sugar phosphate isomerase/epimerase
MKSFILLTIFALGTVTGISQKKPEIGIASDLKNDSLLYALGYRDLVESIAKLFSPKAVSEEQFQKNLIQIKGLRMNIYAVNIFIPGELKLVGPDVNQKAIMEHAKVVFERCKRADINMIVWGSGGARRIPDGFDREKAKAQFIDIASKVSKLAGEYNILIVLENLNSTETNFINTVKEAYEIVKTVDHPQFRLCADIYHMLMDQESPEIILKTKKYLVHCDIAERLNRRPPGINKEDFRPYLRALKQAGYNRKIVLECRWENFAEEAKMARQYLQEQIDEVYK